MDTSPQKESPEKSPTTSPQTHPSLIYPRPRYTFLRTLATTPVHPPPHTQRPDRPPTSKTSLPSEKEQTPPRRNTQITLHRRHGTTAPPKIAAGVTLNRALTARQPSPQYILLHTYGTILPFPLLTTFYPFDPRINATPL